MVKNEDILDRINTLEKQARDIKRNEILGIVECAKRDLLIQQKKHKANLIKEVNSIKRIEKRVNGKIKKLKIYFMLLFIFSILMHFIAFAHRF